MNSDSPPAMSPLTGTQYPLQAGEYAAVVTELGAGLRDLRYRGQPVIDGYAGDELPPGAAGQLLLPWPNRIDGGRYHLAGVTHQLDLSEPAHGNAIHGLTRWSSWLPARHTDSEVTLRLTLLGRAGYPFCLEIEAGYHLDADEGLSVRVTSRNAGSKAAPYGTGSHPYLFTGVPLDGCELTLPAARWLPADERGIPSGAAVGVGGTDTDFRQRRMIGAARLDHALTGLERDGDGRAWASLAGGGTEVALWVGPGYGWLQVFTGDTLGDDRRRRALAVEPMTCPPNAFASGTDLLVLEPGDVVSHTWGIRVTAHTGG